MLCFCCHCCRCRCFRCRCFCCCCLLLLAIVVVSTAAVASIGDVATATAVPVMLVSLLLMLLLLLLLSRSYVFLLLLFAFDARVVLVEIDICSRLLPVLSWLLVVKNRFSSAKRCTKPKGSKSKIFGVGKFFIQTPALFSRAQHRILRTHLGAPEQRKRAEKIARNLARCTRRCSGKIWLPLLVNQFLSHVHDHSLFI